MRIKINELSWERIAAAFRRRSLNAADIAFWRWSKFSSLNLERLERYRDVHSGERAFIIANGPSLARMDLAPLRNELTFSMNRAYLLYESWGFEPSYYVCINELVMEQFAPDIARLSMPRFLNSSRRSLFGSLQSDASVMYLRIALAFKDHFRGDVTRGITSGGTVTFACLQLAYFMGISEAVIIGMDHSFAEKGVPNTIQVRSSSIDESHCHPDYFPKGAQWQLPDLHRSEMAYVLARRAWERDGRQILDATEGGQCDVFEKTSFARFTNPSTGG